MTARFTDENTEGYTDDELDELNTVWDRVWAVIVAEGRENPDLRDYISERLLDEYDNGARGAELIRRVRARRDRGNEPAAS